MLPLIFHVSEHSHKLREQGHMFGVSVGGDTTKNNWLDVSSSLMGGLKYYFIITDVEM